MDALGVVLTGSVFLLGFSDAIRCQAQPAEQGSAALGEKLFSGAVRFQNGGPACASCHTIAGLPFPYGGSMGPDLTKIYSKLGPLGIDPTLQTLFFPAMTAIYTPHPLTDDERSDLRAFLQETDARQPSGPAAPLIILIALACFVVLLVLTRQLWRDRLTGVRRRLVSRATARGGAGI